MSTSEKTYTVFVRSCRNWAEFDSAEKIVEVEDVNLAEARQMCEEFNSNRTDSQIEAGTKMEFTSEM